MKYETVHTLQANQTVDDKGTVKFIQFKPGEVVTEAQLKEAGFDIDHLQANGAVEELKGTETDEDRAERRRLSAIPTTTQDAMPHMGNAPKGDPETNLDAGAAANARKGGKAPADDDAANKGNTKK